MALEENMNLAQMKQFLEEELKEQIFLEIAPILYIGQKTGGYFGVTRQILCLLDFLGALYCGHDGKGDIATSKKAKKFIKDILGNEIDSMYVQNGKLLYDMYRHGLVHLYQPREIKQESGRILKWLAYKGPRQRANIIIEYGGKRTVAPNARHLEILTHPKDEEFDFLPVSITCLYKDLLTAIDIFYKLLEEDKSDKLLKNWQSSANAIVEPELEKHGE